MKNRKMYIERIVYCITVWGNECKLCRLKTILILD